MNGLSFDGTSQWAEVTSWSGTTPCLTHPDSCTGGASLMLWLKMFPDSQAWPNGGILGSLGHAGSSNSDTEGVMIRSDGGGTGIKYVPS